MTNSTTKSKLSFIMNRLFNIEDLNLTYKENEKGFVVTILLTKNLLAVNADIDVMVLNLTIGEDDIIIIDEEEVKPMPCRRFKEYLEMLLVKYDTPMTMVEMDKEYIMNFPNLFDIDENYHQYKLKFIFDNIVKRFSRQPW